MIRLFVPVVLEIFVDPGDVDKYLDLTDQEVDYVKLIKDTSVLDEEKIKVTSDLVMDLVRSNLKSVEESYGINEVEIKTPHITHDYVTRDLLNLAEGYIEEYHFEEDFNDVNEASRKISKVEKKLLLKIDNLWLEKSSDIISELAKRNKDFATDLAKDEEGIPSIDLIDYYLTNRLFNIKSELMKEDISEEDLELLVNDLLEQFRVELTVEVEGQLSEEV